TGQEGRSALATALFAIHPLRVESVVWVAERKDVLSMCAGLAAAAAWVRFTRTGQARMRRGAIALHAASLLAKPTFVTLPRRLRLLDAWPLRRWSRTEAVARLREKVPFFLLSGAGAIIAVAAQGRQGALRAFGDVTAAERLGNGTVAIGRYLLRMVWFGALSPFYPPRAWAAWQIVAGVALIGGITAAVLACRRRVPPLAFGWAWFIVALVPTIGIVQVGEQSLADRSTYLPSVGLAVALVWSLPAGAWRGLLPRPALGLAVGMTLALLALFTVRQTAIWRNSETL